MHKPRTTEQLYAFMTAVLLTRRGLVTDYGVYRHSECKPKTWLILGNPYLNRSSAAMLNAPLTDKKMWIPKYA